MKVEADESLETTKREYTSGGENKQDLNVGQQPDKQPEDGKTVTRPSDRDKKIEQFRPLLFSLSGGAGVQLNVTDHIGVYIEPQMSYFFDDGSDIETIRKETPLNFHFQGGIRFTY